MRAGRELIALTMSGESVPLDETVALAHLETGTHAADRAGRTSTCPLPRLRRSEPEGLPTVGGGGTAGLADDRAGPHVVAGRELQPASARVCDVGRRGGSARRCCRSGRPPGTCDAPVRRGPWRGRLVRRSRGRRSGTPAAAVRPAVWSLVAGLFGGAGGGRLVPGAAGGQRRGRRWSRSSCVAVGMLLAQSTTAPRLLRLTAPVLGVVGGAVATGRDGGGSGRRAGRGAARGPRSWR